ncbi:hypothetical protein CR513_20732, partial [Mucuna pruriens]
MNVPLLDAIRQIPKYSKFLKELCTNKRKKLKSDVEVGKMFRSSSVYRSLRLGALKPTGIMIQLANRSIAHPHVDSNMKDELSSKRPTVILGRPFLKTAMTKIDVHFGTLFVEFGDNRVEYTIFEAMKHPTKNHSIFYLDVINRLGDDYMNLHSKFPDFDDVKDCCTIYV